MHRLPGTCSLLSQGSALVRSPPRPSCWRCRPRGRRPELRRRQGGRAVAAAEVQDVEPRGDPERRHEGLATLPHALRNASEVALLPECLVRIHLITPSNGGGKRSPLGARWRISHERVACGRFHSGGTDLWWSPT